QMRRTPDTLTPPLFGYEPLPASPQGLVLLYDSPRQLCAVLEGAIEGAAERYGERAQVVERTCMKQGTAVCRFEVVFLPALAGQQKLSETPEQRAHQQAQQDLVNVVWSVLPKTGGVTLVELQGLLH